MNHAFTVPFKEYNIRKSMQCGPICSEYFAHWANAWEILSRSKPFSQHANNIILSGPICSEYFFSWANLLQIFCSLSQYLRNLLSLLANMLKILCSLGQDQRNIIYTLANQLTILYFLGQHLTNISKNVWNAGQELENITFPGPTPVKYCL
jgi:hypothetical protein